MRPQAGYFPAQSECAMSTGIETARLSCGVFFKTGMVIGRRVKMMEKPETGAVCGIGRNKLLPKVIKAGNFALPQAFAEWLQLYGIQLNRSVLNAVFRLKRSVDTTGFHAKKHGRSVLPFAVCCKTPDAADFSGKTGVIVADKPIAGEKNTRSDDTIDPSQTDTLYQAGKFYLTGAPHEKPHVSSSFVQFTGLIPPVRAFYPFAVFLPLFENAAAMFPRAEKKPRCLLVHPLPRCGKTPVTGSCSRRSFARESLGTNRFNGNEPNLFSYSSLFLLRLDIIGFKLGKKFFRLFDSNHAFGKKGQNIFACKIVIFRRSNDGKQAKRHFFLSDGSIYCEGSHRIDRRHGLSFFIRTFLPTIVKLPAVLIKKAGHRLVFNKKNFSRTISFQKQSCALLFFVCWLFLSSGFLKRYFAPDEKEKHAALQGFGFRLLAHLHLWKEYLPANDGQQKFIFKKFLASPVLGVFNNGRKIFALFQQSLMQNFLERWRPAFTSRTPLPLGKKRGA